MQSRPPSDVADAVARAHRDEWARVLASSVRVTRDLDLAEECTQDAFERALARWPADGIPDRPGGWLTTVAGNRARDVVRREAHARRLLPLLVIDDDERAAPAHEGSYAGSVLPDDRLRLVFTCCHPALSPEAQVALTLRLVCGLTTAEVARAFLVQESTMAARITRAKKKIATARIPYRVPTREELPERLPLVTQVVHLVFTTGHAAPSGAAHVRQDLVEVAVSMGRMLHGLLPDEPRVTGLLALMLFGQARSSTRVDDDGTLVLLADQDRGRWDRALIEEASSLVAVALATAPPDRFAVEAAIAAVHAESPTWEATDWTELVGLYDVLLGLWPSPVVALGRAVAVGFRDGAEAGLRALEPLLGDPTVATYPYVSATRADLLRRLEDWGDAEVAYEEAVALAGNDVERAFLATRLAEVRSHLPR
ncbi:RNA polymerase sigma factor [Terrabacter carboxydivorans]|uniref:RNA polymerase sigma factor n=1 Tax=Terrabacter carboxydivorans TaxID=619730 RepID=A0ABP5ZA35_9MICO